MDKLKLTGLNLGRVFNCMYAMHVLYSITIRPNLLLKTRPKQLLATLLLDIALPEPNKLVFVPRKLLQPSVTYTLAYWAHL
jgi:hypothetical protein